MKKPGSYAGVAASVLALAALFNAYTNIDPNDWPHKVYSAPQSAKPASPPVTAYGSVMNAGVRILNF
jgi:hypothetical protein